MIRICGNAGQLLQIKGGEQVRRVILESPFKGEDWTQTKWNIAYLRLCVRDCVLRGDSPYASHALFTQPGILDDRVSHERQLGIDAGFAWRGAAEATVVYADFGISEGMRYGIEHAKSAGLPIEYRKLFDQKCINEVGRLLEHAMAPFPHQEE